VRRIKLVAVILSLAAGISILFAAYRIYMPVKVLVPGRISRPGRSFSNCGDYARLVEALVKADPEGKFLAPVQVPRDFVKGREYLKGIQSGNTYSHMEWTLCR